MMKHLFLFLFLVIGLEAKTISVDYRVEFGIIGQVAKVHTDYSTHGNQYTIDTHLSVIGLLAKKVTKNLKERHICNGHINKKGLLIAKSYQMIKHYDHYKSITLYEVNTKNKRVYKTYTKWDISSRKKKVIKSYRQKLRYYATDDLITFFPNLNYYIRAKKIAKNYHFKVVGADKKQGRVDVRIPTKKEAKEMIKLLGKPKKDEWILNLVMHRQLYHSKKGELMVRMGANGFIEKAVLKDLILLGDVRIIKE